METQEQRIATRNRVMLELGVDRMGAHHGVSGWNNAIGLARYEFEQQPDSEQD